MIIYYDIMTESWSKAVFGEKDEILVDMTLEDIEDIDQEFDSEEEFWDWYNCT